MRVKITRVYVIEAASAARRISSASALDAAGTELDHQEAELVWVLADKGNGGWRKAIADQLG